MSDDFLSRWSQRKRGVGAAEEVSDTPAQPEPAREAVPEESDEEILGRLGLKHPDEMGPDDDFGSFLRAAVPRHLKTLAYRRLWRSNPTLACLDGLNDYDGDFTGTGVPEGGLRTAYQVGRGLLGRIAETAENHGTDVPPEKREPDGALDAGAPDGECEAEDTPAAPQSAEILQHNDTPRTARRRMVFRAKG